MARGGAAEPIRWSLPITAAQVEQLIRSERDPRRALSIFQSASAEPSFRHQPSTVSLLLSRLSASPSLLPAAESLLSSFPDLPDLPALPLLLRSHARSHRPSSALRLFRRFPSPPSSKSYVTMLDILVSGDLLKEAHQFYKEMKDAGFHDSLPARNVLIKAFCKNRKTIESALKVFNEMPQRDSYTYGTIISGLCRLGMLEKAVELFNSMVESGCQPDVITYSAVLDGYCKSGRLEDAMRVFEEMGKNGVKPNVITYSALVDGLSKGGRAVEALGILERMAKSRCTPNMVTYSSVVSGLFKEGRLDEALEVMDKMRLQGCKPDAGLYRKLIVGLVDAGRYNVAANFLDEMMLGGIAPNRLTWGLHIEMHNVVIRGLCTGRDPGRAFQVYLGARTRSVSIQPETFCALVSGFCKKRDVHKAVRVMEEMLREGCPPDEGVWNSILCGVWERRQAHEVAESTLTRIEAECWC